MSCSSLLDPHQAGELHALRAEHERLLCENLEYMSVLSRYARALGLCSTLAPEPLAEKILDGLCLETRAQGGILFADLDERQAFSRVALRGVVRTQDGPSELDPAAPPRGLEPLLDPGCGSFLAKPEEGGAGEVLWVRLRHEGRLVAAARLSDRIDAARFDARDLTASEHFAEVAALALSNALRFRRLERRSLRDPRTQAFTGAFFDGIVATELERARRFGRPFSLLEVGIADREALRAQLGEAGAAAWLDRFARLLQTALRASDICAADGEGQHRLLLTETDSVGAAVLKRRIRSLAVEKDGPSPELRIAAATHPIDGTRMEELQRALARSLEREERSPARALEREALSFADCGRRLLREAAAVPPRLPEQALRFVLGEVERRSYERGLLLLSPGGELLPAALEALARMRGRSLRTEITLFSDEAPCDLAAPVLGCLPTQRAGTRAPFLIHLGEESAYAWLRAREDDDAPLFHTADRPLVELLALQLQHDLGEDAVS